MKILILNRLIWMLCSFIFGGIAYGFDFRFDQEIEKSEFESLSKNMISPLRFQFLPSHGGLGLGGGARFTFHSISEESKKIISDRSSQSVPNSPGAYTIMSRMLFFNFMYSKPSHNSFQIFGFGVNKDLDIGPVNLSARWGYSHLQGNEVFCSPSTNGELQVGYSILIFQPYAGFGLTQHKASYSPSAESGLSSYESTWINSYVVAGLSTSLLGMISAGVELENAPNYQAYKIQAAIKL